MLEHMRERKDLLGKSMFIEDVKPATGDGALIQQIITLRQRSDRLAGLSNQQSKETGTNNNSRRANNVRNVAYETFVKKSQFEQEFQRRSQERSIDLLDNRD